jgi:hypothetical protein
MSCGLAILNSARGLLHQSKPSIEDPHVNTLFGHCKPNWLGGKQVRSGSHSHACGRSGPRSRTYPSLAPERDRTPHEATAIGRKHGRFVIREANPGENLQRRTTGLGSGPHQARIPVNGAQQSRGGQQPAEKHGRPPAVRSPITPRLLRVDPARAVVRTHRDPARSSFRVSAAEPL